MRTLTRLLVALAALVLTGLPAHAFPGGVGGGHPVAGSDPTVYPAGVIAADAAHGDTLLHQVWDMRRTPFGPRVGLTPVASYTLSSGLAYDSTNKGLTISATKTVTGVDMTGNGLYIVNTIAATVTDIFLSDNPACCYGVDNADTIGGVNTGAPTTTISYFTANFSDMTQGHAGAIATNGGSLSFDHGDFLTSARDPVTTGGTFNATWTRFGQIGNVEASLSSDHLEFIHWLGSGSGTISYTLFDASQIWTYGGGSGFFQIQSDNAPIPGIMFDHDIFYGAQLAVTHDPAGAPSLGLPVFSLKSVGANDVTITVKNSVVQKTPSGVYVINTHASTGVNHIIDGGGNYDMDSGLPINLTLNGFALLMIPGRPRRPANDNNPPLALAA